MPTIGLVEIVHPDRVYRLLYDRTRMNVDKFVLLSSGVQQEIITEDTEIIKVPEWPESGESKDYPMATWFNDAAKRLDTDILIFWNQDFVSHSGFLEEITYKCKPRTRLCTTWNDIKEDKFISKGRPNPPKTTGNEDNWSMVIWRQDFIDLGGFDERLPFFGHDINLNLRMKKAGFDKQVLSHCYWHLSHDRDYRKLEDRNHYLKLAHELV